MGQATNGSSECCPVLSHVLSHGKYTFTVSFVFLAFASHFVTAVEEPYSNQEPQGDVFKRGEMYAAPSTKHHRFFSFESLDSKILNKICQDLLTTLRLCIVDAKSERGDIYLAIDSFNPELGTGIHTEILRTCKRINEEGIAVLYGQPIIFRGSAEMALAWLHDHSKFLDIIKNLSFVYRFESLPQSVHTNILTPYTTKRGMRHLFNTIVHKCEGLVDFRLIVDNLFWYKCSWQDGVDDVMSSSQGEFLHLFARLALYDEAYNSPWMEGNVGLRVRLHINESHVDQDKIDFVRQLRQHIEDKRASRPHIAFKRLCCCSATTYDDCCFVDLPDAERTGRRWRE